MIYIEYVLYHIQNICKSNRVPIGGQVSNRKRAFNEMESETIEPILDDNTECIIKDKQDDIMEPPNKKIKGSNTDK